VRVHRTLSLSSLSSSSTVKLLFLPLLAILVSVCLHVLSRSCAKCGKRDVRKKQPGKELPKMQNNNNNEELVLPTTSMDQDHNINSTARDPLQLAVS